MIKPIHLVACVVLVGSAIGLRGAGQPAPAGDSRLEEAYRLNNLGVAQLEQYDYDAAAATFGKALDAVPSLHLARVNLAIALLHAGKLAEAEAAAEAARAANPRAPQPAYVLGLAARGDNRPEAAAAAFEQVLALDANDLGARVNLGQIYLQQRRYDEAAALFRAAAESEPYNATAAYNLGVALTRGGHADEGERAMQRFQELRAGGAATTFTNNYLERGRYAEAVTARGAEADLVDPATPAVSFVPQQLRPPADIPAGAGFARGAVTLADVDRDGDLDVLVAGPEGAALLVNDGTRIVLAPRQPPWPSGAASAIVAADFDNDQLPDIAVATAGGLALLRQESAGVFRDVTSGAGITGAAAARTLAFVDVDHDGDVDLLAAGIATPEPSAGASTVRLFRNNGSGAFTDTTAAAGLDAKAPDVAIVPADFDNRRDVDLLFVSGSSGPRLMRNVRDTTFIAVPGAAGLGAGEVTAVAVGDVNKDGFLDVFLASSEGGRFAIGDAGRRFVEGPSLAGAAGAVAALLVDYDNDGLLDLVVVRPDGLRVWRHVGEQWQEVTEAAVPVAFRPAGLRDDPLTAAAAGDLDRDGDVDLVVRARSGRLWMLRNEGGYKLPSVSVRLTGRVSNRSAAGASVEIRAGSLWQRLDLTVTSPPVAPADLVFGLGRRPRADVVRVLWPSGVLQAEAIGESSGRQALLDLTELDRKPSSCPFLYTWNGSRFEFLTDFLGGGEMGYLHAPGVRNAPDPDEYVRIPGDKLVARDGRLELRVTNELEEAVFIDRLQMLAVTHPAGTDVFPAEGLTSPPFRPFGVYVAPALRVPGRALDDRGADVRDRLREVDRRYVDALPLEPIRGYARRHTLTLDLADPTSASAPTATGDGLLLLVLTGWTDYAFSSDNLAAHQAGLSLEPPSLQVRNARGEWETVVREVGLPVGRPQAVVVDLTGKFLSASREVRLVTTMRVYWDQALVDTSGRARLLTGQDLDAGAGMAHGVSVARLEAERAELRWRGFSAEVMPDGREPLSYDYDRVSTTSPWKQLTGRYTREGDVRELLREVDDMFVVSRPGDALQLAFDAAGLQPSSPAVARTYLLFAHGYSKEMDLSSASPDQVGPLPFRGMSRYPYAWPERYPDTPAHRAYLERYNTRGVGRTLPALAAPEAASHRRDGSTAAGRGAPGDPR